MVGSDDRLSEQSKLNLPFAQSRTFRMLLMWIPFHQKPIVLTHQQQQSRFMNSPDGDGSRTTNNMSPKPLEEYTWKIAEMIYTSPWHTNLFTKYVRVYHLSSSVLEETNPRDASCIRHIFYPSDSPRGFLKFGIEQLFSDMEINHRSHPLQRVRIGWDPAVQYINKFDPY